MVFLLFLTTTADVDRDGNSSEGRRCSEIADGLIPNAKFWRIRRLG
jgi:hypothetical protein